MLLPLIKNKWTWLLIPLLTACHSHTVYHSYCPVPPQGWGKGDTLVYQLPASIPEGVYDLEIGIRYQEGYPYRDIWLAVSRHLTDSALCATDTLHFFLTDEAGNKTQNSPGALYQYTAHYPTPISLQDTDTIRSFHLVHLMKDNPLRGITDMGIRLTQHP